MTDKTATLGVEGTNHQFMLLDGTVGPEVIDIRKLYGETGLFTYDPGFTSTASCESAGRGTSRRASVSCRISSGVTVAVPNLPTTTLAARLASATAIS